jgi:probable HAF family extracellular repeat protein
MKNAEKLLFWSALLCVSVATLKAEVAYKLTILGTLGEYNCTTPLSINNSGQIVGTGVSNISPNHSRAILFDTTGNGQNIDLGTLGGQGSWANCISNNGQIVGAAVDNSYAPVGSSYFKATLFDPTGGKNNISLGTLNGLYSQAEAVNDSGQTVGEVWPFGGNSRAVLFDSSGNNNSIILDKRQGNPESSCSSINNYGQIVGEISYYNSAGWHSNACLFDPTGNGNNIELGTITDGGDSVANHINDNGQIVGYATNSFGYCQATLFDPTGNGHNINLGTLAASGYNASEACSINNKGQIVGLAYNNDTWTAVLFDTTGNGNNIDLNTLIDPSSDWNLMLATAINDNGWIVGYAMNSLGQGEAFLLTPIPEPITLLLVGLGAAMLRRKC